MIRIISGLTVAWVAGSMSFAGIAHEGEQQAGQTVSPTREQRRQMAQLHQKQAECLLSDRPIEECRNEMQQSCRTMMDGQGCMTMGMGQPHGHGGGMGQPRQKPSEQKQGG